MSEPSPRERRVARARGWRGRFDEDGRPLTDDARRIAALAGVLLRVGVRVRSIGRLVHLPYGIAFRAARHAYRRIDETVTLVTRDGRLVSIDALLDRVVAREHVGAPDEDAAEPGGP